jgi:hypothetical protein
VYEKISAHLGGVYAYFSNFKGGMHQFQQF